jgi:hypothetical protein
MENTELIVRPDDLAELLEAVVIEDPLSRQILERVGEQLVGGDCTWDTTDTGQMIKFQNEDGEVRSQVNITPDGVIVSTALGPRGNRSRIIRFGVEKERLVIIETSESKGMVFT